MIILSAAVVLAVVGILYRQAACILVDSVLFQLAVFFSLLGMTLHWIHRQVSVLLNKAVQWEQNQYLPFCREERRAALAGPAALTGRMEFYTGWSLYLALLGVILSTMFAIAMYILSRLLISIINTVPNFKQNKY